MANVFPGQTVTININIRNIGGAAGSFWVESEIYYTHDDPSAPGSYAGRFDYPHRTVQTPVAQPNQVVSVSIQKQNWWDGQNTSRDIQFDIVVIVNGEERWFSKAIFMPQTEPIEQNVQIVNLDVSVS